MKKEIDFKPKQRRSNISKEVLADVERSVAEPTKRVAFDIPASLHKRIRIACAQEGVNLSDITREFFKQRFPDKDTAPEPPSPSDFLTRPPEN